MLAQEILTNENHDDPSVANQSRPHRKILVVDDEPLLCQLYGELLTETGFEVDATPDGASAWEALQSKEYDLVITDNQMPVLSGMELLLKMHHARLTVPVILTSATWPSDDFLPWLQPAFILVKPYGPEKLIEAVRQVLSIA